MTEVNPYIGPRPFEQKHEHLFFGRRREIRDLLSLVIAHGEVLLYAQSGAGKTSLINAGLVEAARKKRFDVQPLARVQGMLPKNVRLEEINNIFVFFALTHWTTEEVDPKKLARLSFKDFFNSDFLLKKKNARRKNDELAPRLIIFDQFEELFTALHEHENDRKDFFVQIAELLETDPRLRVLISIREDYLARLDPYLHLLPDRLATRYRLEPLREEMALLAVKNPLQKTDRSFAEGVAVDLVRELMKVRVQGISGEVKEVVGRYIEPVQLQIVCKNIWDSLPIEDKIITVDHIRSLGDVDTILRRFFENALHKALQTKKVREKEVRNFFTNKIITPALTRGTVFRGRDHTEGIPNNVIDVLAEERIIRAESRAGARWYELTHDRLIKPVLDSNTEYLTRLARQKGRYWWGAATAALVLFLTFGLLWKMPAWSMAKGNEFAEHGNRYALLIKEGAADGENEQKKDEAYNTALNYYKISLWFGNLSTQYTNTLYAQGYVLQQMGRTDEAMKSFKKCLELDPEHVDAFKDLVNILKKKQLWENDPPYTLDEFNSKYDMAVSENSKIAVRIAGPFENRARNLLSAGKQQEALRSYLMSMQLAPDHLKQESYTNIVQTIESDKTFRNEIEKHGINLMKYPQVAKAYLDYGNSFVQKKEVSSAEFAKAVEMYEKALRIEPESADAYMGLGFIHFRQKNYTDALDFYRNSFSKARNNPKKNRHFQWQNLKKNIEIVLQQQKKTKAEISSYLEELGLSDQQKPGKLN